MDTYPHVFFTSPDEWDPSVLDHYPPHLDGLDPSQVPDQPFGDPMFDAYGYFNERCWKPSSLLSNVHFRNTTKIAVQVLLLLTLFTFTFEPFLKL